MLDLDETYLSEIDDTLPKVRSVIGRVTPGATVLFKSEKGALAVTETPSSSKRDLFPNPPSKIDPERNNGLTECNLFERKPSSQFRHSSNYRKQFLPSNRSKKRKTHINEGVLKGAIGRAKDRVRQNAIPPRSAQFISPPRNKPSATVTSNVQRPASVFGRLNPSFRIPKLAPVTKDAEVQVDLIEKITIIEKAPCKCTKRLAAKNRNRREKNKQNRDLVKKYELDRANQNK